MLIVDCLSQVMEMDGETMEAVSEPGASVDAGNPELVCEASPRLSDHGEKDNSAAAEKEVESKEIEHKETEAAVGPSPVSPLNPSPSQSSFSTEESTVLVQGGEPDSTAESEKEDTEVKLEEDFELNEENVLKTLEESPAGPDVSEDTNMDKTSDHTKENTDVKMDPDIDTQQENVSLACKFMVSTADDLDEMMDIGTVDQVEQEAQMKEEEQDRLMDVDSGRSPAISNTGKVKQKSCLNFYLKVFVLNEAEKTFRALLIQNLSCVVPVGKEDVFLGNCDKVKHIISNELLMALASHVSSSGKHFCCACLPFFNTTGLHIHAAANELLESQTSQ